MDRARARAAHTQRENTESTLRNATRSTLAHIHGPSATQRRERACRGAANCPRESHSGVTAGTRRAQRDGRADGGGGDGGERAVRGRARRASPPPP